MSVITYSAMRPGGLHHPHRRRRLSFSLAIALVVEAGLIAWVFHSVVYTVRTESAPVQTPITVHIVQPQVKPQPKPQPKPKPRVLTPIPMQHFTPDIQPPPPVPQLSAMNNTQVVPPITESVPPPPPNSIYVPPSFLQQIYAAIDQRKIYPQAALVNGYQGTVVVAFLYEDGHATRVRVTRSSGSTVLDSEAVEMVISAHLPRALPNLTGTALKLAVPITFSLPG